MNMGDDWLFNGEIGVSMFLSTFLDLVPLRNSDCIKSIEYLKGKVSWLCFLLKVYKWHIYRFLV